MGCSSKGLFKKRLFKKLLNFFIIGIIIFGSCFIFKIHINVKADEGSTTIKNWTDTFQNNQNIDTTLSYNCTISSGKVIMNNTNSHWTNLDWKSFKNITIQNYGIPLSNYPIFFKIYKEEDMKSDFSDIRFREEGLDNWLSYWIESINYCENYANVWVKLFNIPQGKKYISLFYNNSSAISESSYNSVFQWNKLNSDKKISENKLECSPWGEVAWNSDSSVAYGNDKFISVWYEGKILYAPCVCFSYKLKLKVAFIDKGGNIQKHDFFYENENWPYRNEKPSVDYGDGWFFIAWEHYDTGYSGTGDESTRKIYCRLIKYEDEILTFLPQNVVIIPFDSGSYSQANPEVKFDSENKRFCVAFEQGKSNSNDRYIYARLYGVDAQPIENYERISPLYKIAKNSTIAFDPDNKQYLFVWEQKDSLNSNSKIMMQRFGLDLSKIDNQAIELNNEPGYNYINPHVEFCKETKRFLITYDKYSPNNDKLGVNGNIISSSGTELIPNISITQGLYSQNNIVPYLSSHFFVSYRFEVGSTNKIYGVLINSMDGNMLSHFEIPGSNFKATWPSMAVSEDGKIFISWRDKRDAPTNFDAPRIYGQILNLYNKQLTHLIKSQEDLILDAQVISKQITATNFIEWKKFIANDNPKNGEIRYFISAPGLSETEILSNQDIPEQFNNSDQIWLKAIINRQSPTDSPEIKDWSVSWLAFSDANQGTLELDKIEYSNPKPCYKNMDDVRIFANFTAVDDNIGLNKVKIIIKDENENILYDEEMNPIDSVSCPNCYWYNDWSIRISNPDYDGYIIVSISAFNNKNEEISISNPEDKSKKLDNTKPIIEGIVHTIGYSSATIHGLVNEVCDNYLYYGLSKEYEKPVEIKYGNLFNYYLENLQENETYYYKISCYDIAGNSIDSSDYTFTTGRISSSQNDSQGDIITADAGGPYYGSINEPIEFNGSKSFSPNATVIWYRWDFDNDGIFDKISLIKPTANNIYKNVGNRTVKLEIEDNFGQIATNSSLAIIYESYKKMLENLTKDNQTRLNIEGTTDTIIVFLEITPAKDLTNVKIITNDYGMYKPKEIIKELKAEDLKHILKRTDQNIIINVFRYIDISIFSNDVYINDFDIKTTDVVFKVKEVWLKENNIEPENITLIRYHNNGWEKINTTKIGYADGNSWHLAKVTGFSTFAVVGSKVVEKGESLKPEDKPIPWILIFGFIISAVVILIFILFKTKFIYLEDADTKEKEEKK